MRSSLTSPWVFDRAIPVLSTQDAGNNFAANAFTLMPDGLTAFYQYYYSGGASGIWATTRPNIASSDWGAPKTIPGMASDQAFGRFGPFLSSDGKHVYFQSTESGSGDHAHHMDVADGGVSPSTSPASGSPLIQSRHIICSAPSPLEPICRPKAGQIYPQISRQTLFVNRACYHNERACSGYILKEDIFQLASHCRNLLFIVDFFGFQ
jgi:hypothetical protein